MDLRLAEGIKARIGFQIGEDRFVLGIADQAVTLARAETDGCDLVFTGPTSVIGAAAYGGVPIADLERSGELKIEGDRNLAKRFLSLFPLPPKADLSR